MKHDVLPGAIGLGRGEQIVGVIGEGQELLAERGGSKPGRDRPPAAALRRAGGLESRHRDSWRRLRVAATGPPLPEPLVGETGSSRLGSSEPPDRDEGGRAAPGLPTAIARARGDAEGAGSAGAPKVDALGSTADGMLGSTAEDVPGAEVVGAGIMPSDTAPGVVQPGVVQAGAGVT